MSDLTPFSEWLDAQPGSSALRIRDEICAKRIAELEHEGDHWCDLAAERQVERDEARAKVERLRAEVGCKHECAEVEYECRRLSDEVERLRPVLAAAEAILGYSQTGSDAVFIDWDRYFDALQRAVKAAKEAT